MADLLVILHLAQTPTSSGWNNSKSLPHGLRLLSPLRGEGMPFQNVQTWSWFSPGTPCCSSPQRPSSPLPSPQGLPPGPGGKRIQCSCRAAGWASRAHTAFLPGFTPHHSTTCRAQPVDHPCPPFHLTSSHSPPFPCSSDSFLFLECPGSQSSLPAFTHVALPHDSV